MFSIDLMSVLPKSPKVANVGELASAVVYRMEQHGIVVMPVVNDDHVMVGVVHLHDLMRARVS